MSPADSSGDDWRFLISSRCSTSAEIKNQNEPFPLKSMYCTLYEVWLKKKHIFIIGSSFLPIAQRC